MVYTTPLAVTAASLLLLHSALANGIYSQSSPVLQVDAKNYHSLISSSNHTSIVEFYAPWCGHCQKLKPAYEKAAKNLAGLAKVAAINCDEESNKPFCGQMGVQGFPTLKIVKPSKKPGRPMVEDYKGPREAKPIVDAVVDQISNHVKRVTDKTLEEWLGEDKETAKAVLFSNKGTVSALLKAVAIDFLGNVNVGQIRDKEKQATEVFGVTKFPTLVLLPGGDKEPIIYDGEMKKDPIVNFLSQIAPPNPDPAHKAAKGDKPSKYTGTSKSKSSKSQSSKMSEDYSKASSSHRSEESLGIKATQTSETLEDASNPTESPDPNVVTDDTQKPVKVQDLAPPIPTLTDEIPLQHACLNTNAHNCILALLPSGDSDAAAIQALSSLAEIHHKHAQAKRKIMPFYAISASNPSSASIRSALSLGADGVQLVATNGKKAWSRLYSKTSYSYAEVEDWIDGIRMGEGAKAALPDSLLADPSSLPEEHPYEAPPKPAQPAEPLEVKMEENLHGKTGHHEGLDYAFEEITDEEVEIMLAHASQAAKEAEAKGEKVMTENNAEATPESENVVVDEEEEEHDEL